MKSSSFIALFPEKIHKVSGWWWVLAFAITSFCGYEQVVRKIDQKITELEYQAKDLKREIDQAKFEQEKLSCTVETMNDPTAIELTLIQALGLVPEGYTKIYFEEEDVN